MKMFDEKKNLVCEGFNDYFAYNYNRHDVKCRNERIKEWDFYQFKSGVNIFQVIVAHALIFDNYYVGIFNIETNERELISFLKLHTNKSLQLIDNPEKDYLLTYEKKNFHLENSLVNGHHHLIFSGLSQTKKLFKAEVEFDSNDSKMNILHPFKESKHMFYLNFKENYFDCKLHVSCGNFEISDEEATGVLDYGRGYWPYNNMWYWGNNSFILNGIRIGWNLGYGFGICKDSENIIYYDNKSYKIGSITSTIDINDPMKAYTIDSNDGAIHLELTPFYDNYSKTKILWINKWCHQVYHKTSGYIIVGNNRIEFKDIISFFEFEENHW